MKVYLTFNKDEEKKEEYENVVISTNSVELPFFLGSIAEIVADEILEKYTYNDVPKIIKNMVDSLQFGGKLIIFSQDIDEITYCFHHEYFNVEEMNNKIYGSNNKSCLTLKLIERILQSCQVKIVLTKISSQKLMITAIRQ
jgi:predicted SAM-dependent methyltransferase